MVQHVPAWKKLGLKLKYAKETADYVKQPQSTLENPLVNGTANGSAKRSRDEDGEAQDGRSKKRKTHSKSKADPPQPVNSGLGISLNGSSDTSTPGSKSTSLEARHKDTPAE